MFHCCFQWAILLLSPFFLCAQEDKLAAYMAALEGRWVGHFIIHSPASGYSETFVVKQDYWIDDGALWGVAVSERKSGLQSARSRTHMEGGILISEVMRGTDKEIFIGVFHEGGILWLPANMARAEDYQIKETIVMQAGQRKLETEGFDSYNYEGDVAHIIYRGKLTFVE